MSASARTALRVVAIASLWLGSILAFHASAASRPFGSGDEVIYAQNIREMIRSGELWTLRWHGIEVLQRPSFPFVLSMLGAFLMDGELGLRLWSVAASALVLVLLYAQSFDRFRRHDVSALAALACAGVPTFHAYAPLLLSDASFVLGTTIAFIATLRAPQQPRWLVVVGAGLGWATACKSLAVLVPSFALLPFALHVGFKRRAYGSLGGAIAAYVALAGPFYVQGFAQHGVRFWQEHFVYSLFGRARGGLGTATMGGPTAYLRWLWSADGALCVAWMAAACVVCAVLARRRGHAALWLLALAPVAMLTLYSALGSRLPHYLLPIYPIVALALAYAYAYATGEQRGLCGLRGTYAPLLGICVLLIGQWSDAAEVYLKYDGAAVTLGKEAAKLAARDEPIYIHEWYAPALGYYADRPFKLTTAVPARYRALQSVDFFAAAGIAVAVPPAPLPPGRSVLMAAAPRDMAAARWFRPQEVLATAGNRLLARGITTSPSEGPR